MAAPPLLFAFGADHLLIFCRDAPWSVAPARYGLDAIALEATGHTGARDGLRQGPPLQVPLLLAFGEAASTRTATVFQVLPL